MLIPTAVENEEKTEAMPAEKSAGGCSGATTTEAGESRRSDHGL